MCNNDTNILKTLQNYVAYSSKYMQMYEQWIILNILIFRHTHGLSSYLLTFQTNGIPWTCIWQCCSSSAKIMPSVQNKKRISPQISAWQKINKTLWAYCFLEGIWTTVEVSKCCLLSHFIPRYLNSCTELTLLMM